MCIYTLFCEFYWILSMFVLKVEIWTIFVVQKVMKEILNK